jgi:hypothetical protein
MGKNGFQNYKPVAARADILALADDKKPDLNPGRGVRSGQESPECR